MSRKTQSFEAWEKRKCKAKKSYADIRDAEMRAASDWGNHRQNHYVYKCVWCDSYHLTSNKPDYATFSYVISAKGLIYNKKSQQDFNPTGLCGSLSADAT